MLFEDLLDDPQSYGFEFTDTPATDEPEGTDADDYVFWDDLHPTSHTHALIGDVVAAYVVPDPATLMLSVIGGMALIRRTRRG